MTKQTVIFDLYAYFDSPEKFGVDKDNKCLLRTSNDQVCAVGLYIPKDRYNSRLEKLELGVLIRELPDIFKLDDIDFWGIIRLAHDLSNSNVEYFRSGLKKVCALYDLIFPQEVKTSNERALSLNTVKTIKDFYTNAF